MSIYDLISHFNGIGYRQRYSVTINGYIDAKFALAQYKKYNGRNLINELPLGQRPLITREDIEATDWIPKLENEKLAKLIFG